MPSSPSGLSSGLRRVIPTERHTLDLTFTTQGAGRVPSAGALGDTEEALSTWRT